MGLYERIKAIAESKGYSINRLEKELGFPRSSINKYNSNVPSMDKIVTIADFLGVSVDAISKDNPSDDGYYFDPRTAEIAQAIANSKELGGLFDAARKASPEDLITVQTMLEALHRKEKGE